MTASPQNFIIGTRGSLLALTQCLQVKEELERISPHKFQLKVIKTEGDENTSAPLWQLDGKDFFTKELDAALLKGEVDMVVHSYKDLGSERPEGIKLWAITERKFPQDILFVSKETIEKLKAGKLSTFSVGTSSPRRMVNLKKELQSFLPFGEKNNLKVETKNLRGNVNTRLGKVVSKEFDAVVLALAGIERLALGLTTEKNEAHEKFGRPEAILKDLIKDLDFMILPTSTFPAAASQGALGIESLENRNDDGVLHSLLEKLNHQKTIREVKREREMFQSFGGGCHLAVGITFTEKGPHMVKSIAGEHDHKPIKDHSLDRQLPKLEIKTAPFIGLPKNDRLVNYLRDHHVEKEILPIQNVNQRDDLFITSPFVAKNLGLEKYNSLWASGTKTMKELAKKGYWVNGSSDSLGEEYLHNLRTSHLVKLFLGEENWKSLTNDSASTELGETTPLYKKIYKNHNDEKYRASIESCEHFYWTSFPQYQFFNKQYALIPTATHYCGLGKTLKRFEDNNIKVTPIGSMTELKKHFDLEEESP